MASPDSFRKDFTHLPILLFQRNEGMAKYAVLYISTYPDTRGRSRLIPTAPNIDSLGDSQIRESLTRCWLLKEEQHRWVQRLRSDGLISVSYTHLTLPTIYSV